MTSAAEKALAEARQEIEDLIAGGPEWLHRLAGAVLSALDDPYLPIAPEWQADAEILASARAVLIIENLTSFHRQVRECPQNEVIVVHLGGFPNQAILGLLRRFADTALSSVPSLPFHHWGDVDAGGIRILRRVRKALGVEVKPHAMEIAAVRRYGTPFASPPRIAADPLDSPEILALVEYLRGPEPRWLEQETLAPRPVP